jgi:hypothetical protein
MNLSESRAITGGQHGYSDVAAPDDGNILEYYSVTYYDDYDMPTDSNYDGSADVFYLQDSVHFPDNVPTTRTRGLVTAIKVKALNYRDRIPEWLWTYTFYDKYGRELQTQATNHLAEGTDVVTYRYHFSGELAFSKHRHTSPVTTPGEITLYQAHRYDPRGRQILTQQKIEVGSGSGIETEYTTLNMSNYDALGQLSRKGIGFDRGEAFLQSVDYRYNIRGWLTHLNDSFPVQNSENDLFHLQLSYHDNPLAGVSGGLTISPQYNGNISAIQWQHTLTQTHHINSYSYDWINRLTQTDYSAYQADLQQFPDSGRYNTAYSYDQNGNILTLQRWGVNGASSFGLMDDLTYSYGNGNQLDKVDEAGYNTSLLGVEQFIDGTNGSSNDYSYDSSGNLTEDQNKGITSIIIQPFE